MTGVMFLASVSLSGPALADEARSGDEQWAQDPSMDAYLSWLDGHADESGAQALSAEVSALSPSEQEAFVAAISDPEIVSRAFDVDVDPGETVELDDGNVSVSVGFTEDGSSQNVSTGEYWRDMNVAGVRVVRTTVFVTYEHNGQIATNTIGNSSSWENFIPLTSMSATDQEHYVDTGLAYTSTIFQLSWSAGGAGFTRAGVQHLNTNPSNGPIGRWDPL